MRFVGIPAGVSLNKNFNQRLTFRMPVSVKYSILKRIRLIECFSLDLGKNWCFSMEFILPLKVGGIISTHTSSSSDKFTPDHLCPIVSYNGNNSKVMIFVITVLIPPESDLCFRRFHSSPSLFSLISHSSSFESSNLVLMKQLSFHTL